jgi:glucokinase
MSLRAGVDLGGTKIQIAIVDGDHDPVGKARTQTPEKGGPEKVVEAIAAAVSQACADAGVETRALAGVGVGSPGDVNPATGTVASARNLPEWNGSFALGPALESTLELPTRIGNDVSVAVSAESKLGAGKPYSSLIGVFWGTGVGGGVVLDGELWHGRGGAGEIGHMVVKMGGRRCGCGRRGCTEAYAGRASMEAQARKLVDKGQSTKLFEIMKEHGRDRATSGVWQRALKHGDKLVTQIIDEAVEALGAAIGSAANLLDVEAVLIGGGLGTRLADPYVGRIEEAMLPHVFKGDDPPKVLPVSLGDLGGAIGAALLVESPSD